MKQETVITQSSRTRWTLLLFTLTTTTLSLYHKSLSVINGYQGVVIGREGQHIKREAEIPTVQTTSSRDKRATSYKDRNAAFSPFEVNAVAVEVKHGHTRQCSCMNPSADVRCCIRRLHKAHKMGVVLTNSLLQNYSKVERVTGRYRYPSQEKLNLTDYREVILVRNIYEALASGYLYHKSGRECWLNQDGNPWKRNGYQDMLQWTSQTLSSYTPNPPAQGRNLCEYMKDESTSAGMQAYVSWVLGRHYQGIPGQWEVAQLPAEYGRTLFVCFEDLTNPSTDRITLDRMADFWFPGSNATWKGRRTAANVEYKGGHGTSHDTEIRSTLRKVVEELDHTYFDGWVANFDSILPCR